MSTTQIIDPATEEVVDTVAQISLAETDAAIERARRVFETWRTVDPADRARLLRRFAEAVDADLEHLARLEVRSAGHTIGNARWEAGNVRDVLTYYPGAPERPSGRQIPVPGGVNITFSEPLGVVGVIVPWNFPMPIAGWGLAPRSPPGTRWCSSPPSSLRAPRSGSASWHWRRGSRRACSPCSRARGRWWGSAS